MRELGGNVRILPIEPEENTEARALSWEACREAQLADGKTPALHSRWVLLDLAHAAGEQAFGMDDARRRAWQQAITGKTSCKDMTAEELQRLVDSLPTCRTKPSCRPMARRMAGFYLADAARLAARILRQALTAQATEHRASLLG